MKIFSVLILLISIQLNAQSLEARSTSVLCDGTSQDQISFADQVQPRSSNEITLITWNAHKFGNAKFFEDLKRLANSSDLVMIQEAMHTAELQAMFSSQMPFSFSFFKSFCQQSRATGVMTAARSYLENNLTLISPDVEPIIYTHKVTGYSQIKINDHSLNANTGSDFNRQIESIVKFMSQLSGPIIWAGDFNTWTPQKKAFLNKMTATVGLRHLIPANDKRKLVLDHIYVRGFTATETEVLPENTSDHKPLRTKLKLQ
jgi:endonuclease/exonuclease/phosphatase (EEP) superfamily protein YafD